MGDLIRPSKGLRLLDFDLTINGDAEKVRVCRKSFRPFFKVNLHRWDAIRVILVFRKHPLNHIIILRRCIFWAKCINKLIPAELIRFTHSKGLRAFVQKPIHQFFGTYKWLSKVFGNVNKNPSSDIAIPQIALNTISVAVCRKLETFSKK